MTTFPPYPMTETLPNLHAVFRAMSIARDHTIGAIVFDAARSQIDREPTYREVVNLGWLLRHSGDVEDLYVMTSSSRLYGAPAWPENVSAVLAARVRGGKVYACTFADRSVLAAFLDRPRFIGLRVAWNHHGFFIGSDDYRATFTAPIRQEVSR